jgi:tRNA (guanine37-N1)-methyltransferase
MVLKPEPLVAAIEAARAANPGAPAVMLTPQGRLLSAELVESLAALPGLVLVCGRYEGVDERVRHFVDDEVSIGDYVLSGGETAALVVIEAVSRHVSGVLGNRDSLDSESFASGTLEYPQYTRPVEFRGMRVPEVLLSGDHGRVAAWRRAMALLRTKERRPDLFAGLTLSPEDRRLLETQSKGRGAPRLARWSSGRREAASTGGAEGDQAAPTAEAGAPTEPDEAVTS